MAIEHVDIPDGERHEPKGASTATAGQIWVADGLGSGTFENTIRNCHGQMNIVANTTAKTITAAVDSTLNTNTDYVKMTGAAFPWVNYYAHNVNFSTDKLILGFAGYYMISFWGAFKMADNNQFIGIKYAINDTTPYSVQKLVGRAGTANDIESISAVAIVGPVNANDTLSMYLAGTISGNVTLQDGGLMVTYLHA